MTVEIRKLHRDIGVEVLGFEPRLPLDEETARTLRTAFDECGLLLFRDLQIDLASQNYLSQAMIGADLTGIDWRVVPENVREYYISNREERGGAPFGRLLWHSDMMWSESAFQLLGLYGVDVEQPSTPTLFVSATHAWDTLPSELRSRVEGRFAVHGHEGSYIQKESKMDSNLLVSSFAVNETVRLPIGRRHPRTEKTILYVCQQMTQGIDGLPEEESQELLEALFQHLYASEENVFAHQWRKGDLVLWDNLTLQHARPNLEHEGPARTLRKTYAPPASAKSMANRPRHHLATAEN